MKTVCIINYGARNVKSLKNAFDRVGVDSQDELTEEDLLWAKYPTKEEIL